jgi:anaphase-promoting complex subunit 6
MIRLLDNEPYSMDCLPLHVANLAQLNKSNDLFLLSYDLIEKYPSQAMSWFAIGTYYLMIRKYTEARQFFG